MMSYDVWIKDKNGQVVFDSNMTSNVSAMWHDHFGIEGGLLGLDGMTWKQAKPHFKEFWNSLNRERRCLYVEGVRGEPKFCEKYDAKNGWGSAVGAMTFIAEIQSAWAMNPKATLHVSA